MMFDYAHFRKAFPAMAEVSDAYLDSAATTFISEPALRAWTRIVSTPVGSPGRGDHILARRGRAELDSARNTLAELLGCGPDSVVVFTAGTTPALNSVASGLEPMLRPGDRVLVSEMEHHANLLPWRCLASRTQAHLELIRVRDNGDLDFEQLRKRGPRGAKVLAVTAMSNVTGHQPVLAEMVSWARRVGCLVILDAAQAVAHGPLSFDALGVDFMCLSAHKVGGPRGIGALVARAEALRRLGPTILGGGMVLDPSTAPPIWKEGYEAHEAGTRDVAGAVSFSTALRFWHAVEGFRHVSWLGTTARNALESMDWIRPLPSGSQFGPGIISFVVEGWHAHDVAEYLAEQGVIVRRGHMCAQPVVRRFGHSAVCRASFAPYSAPEDVTRFIEALEGLRQ